MKPALAILAAVLLLAGCGSKAGMSSSPSTAIRTFPIAAPVTPKPGEPFVGYWVAYEPHSVALSIEVLRQGATYEVSMNGEPSIPVRLQRDHLVLGRARLYQLRQQLPGGVPTELLWRRGHCVLSLNLGPYAARPALVDLVRQDRAAYVKTVDGIADYEAWHELSDLAQWVQGWAFLRPPHKPPAPSQLRPGSTFVSWIRTNASPWSWPRNPFTGQPMNQGTAPGDFTYTVNGRTWKLMGHASDGSTWNAFRGFPRTVPTESPSPGM